MKKSTTSPAAVPTAIVKEAWQQVSVSFERFCLTAGIATVNGGAKPGHWGGVKPGQFGRGGGRSVSALFNSAVASERPGGFGF